MEQKREYDLFIIGGGINGTAVAVDAASRGLRVGLVEQNDLGSGTSSWSTKLIHGGLRYLETKEFLLVRKSLKERDILMRRAAFLIRPQEFIIPDSVNMRRPWFVRIGLWIYDHLYRSKLLPRSSRVALSNTRYGAPLNSDIEKGFRYYDAKTDDCRLVVLNATTARRYGADINTRLTCVSAKYDGEKWQIICEDGEQQQRKYRARVLINAAGPWVNEVIENTLSVKVLGRITMVQGSHIVIPKLYDGDHAYLLQSADNRIVFAIPFHQKWTLIGTTDTPFEGNPSECSITDDEKSYLIDLVNRHFNAKLKIENIIWAFAGVRALCPQEEGQLQKLSREHLIDIDDIHRMVTIFGGKLTSHRVLAEEVVDACKPFFSELPSSKTAQIFLTGGDFAGESLASFCQSSQKRYSWLKKTVLDHYISHYGVQVHVLLKNVDCLQQLGEHFGCGLYAKEIDYLIEYEWAVTMEDVLWRRTKYGLLLDHDQVARVDGYIQHSDGIFTV